MHGNSKSGGIAKHRRSGVSGPSPKAKLMRELETNRKADEQKILKQRASPMFSTVAEAMAHRRRS